MTSVKSKLRTRVMLTVAVAAICGGTIAYGAQVSLKWKQAPEPSTLGNYVKDRNMAIALGKALFWDMQAGSDGIQACASCHFNAGADSRTKNQVSPGLLRSTVDTATHSIIGNKDTSFESGPNNVLKVSEFPFAKHADVLDRYTLTSFRNDVISSQGVMARKFERAFPGIPFDFTSYISDPDGFQVNSINPRRVEPRNTPSVINAVFNHRNFWDGRAQNIFNGVSPFGAADPGAFLFKDVNGALTKVRESIDNASLASQAVGPPLSFFEMSAKNRIFPDIGLKMLGVRPLARQQVSQQDSVLGPFAETSRPGLNTGYKDMIKNAFKEEWYNSKNYVRATVVDGRIVSTEVLNPIQGFFSRLAGERTYTQAEWNFSLFWGLAIQMYEATLVSGDTPFDRYLDGDTSAMTAEQVEGFKLFGNEMDGAPIPKAQGAARCSNCHGGIEMTDASVDKVTAALNATGGPNGTGVGPLRRRQINLIDLGFNNIGVSPTTEDLGVGGQIGFSDGSVLELSLARRAMTNPSDPNASFVKKDANGNITDIFGSDGGFKIPSLRNIALTAPYFHNGGTLTLSDVLDFYFRGGDHQSAAFSAGVKSPATQPPTAPIGPNVLLPQGLLAGFDHNRANALVPPNGIRPVGTLSGQNFDNVPAQNTSGILNATHKAQLLAFLLALTDDRVKFEKAPFDHPQLFVPNGHLGDENSVVNLLGNALDAFMEIPVVGAGGTTTPQKTFAENLAP